jgi:hypothetical protein
MVSHFLTNHSKLAPQTTQTMLVCEEVWGTWVHSLIPKHCDYLFSHVVFVKAKKTLSTNYMGNRYRAGIEHLGEVYFSTNFSIFGQNFEIYQNLTKFSKRTNCL